MSKTFKSAIAGYNVQVNANPQGPGLVILGDDGYLAGSAIVIPKEEVPAIALAILEAAGVEPLSEHYGDDTIPATSLSRAAHYLSVYANQVNAAAKEAADREALELEALELYNKVMRSGKDPLSEWLPTLQFTRIKYTNIATAARELHGGTK